MAKTAQKTQKTQRTQPPPLKVDEETNQLINETALRLDMTKKEVVAEAVRFYVTARLEEMRLSMVESMKRLDSTEAQISALTGLSAERLRELGGVEEIT